MTDEIAKRFLENPDFETYPLLSRLNDCVEELTLKTLEYEELQSRCLLHNNARRFPRGVRDSD